MEESKIMVKTFEFTLLNGKKLTVNMNSRAPYSSQRAIAFAMADNVMQDNGFFDPSQEKPTYLVGLFMFYADKQLPDMPYDQLMEFERNNHVLEQLSEFIEDDDLFNIAKWSMDLIEYRQKALGKNSFDRAVEQITAALKETLPQLLEAQGNAVEQATSEEQERADADV